MLLIHPAYLVLSQPHLPQSAEAPKRLAAKLCAMPTLSVAQKTILNRLGHDAVTAALKACRTHDEPRRRFFEDFVVKHANPGDTRAIYWALQWMDNHPTSRNPFEGEPLIGFRNWIWAKGDPEFLILYDFKKFKLATNDVQGSQYVSALLRSRKPEVIDFLFATLKNPSANAFVRREIYQGIARTQRPDILSWISKSRLGTRKLASPDPNLPSDKDSDGDGIPDSLDINPYVAPRKMGEEERVFQVVFDTALKFTSVSGPVAVRFPEGYAPFELVGCQCSIVPDSPDTQEKIGGPFRYFHLSFTIDNESPNQVRQPPKIVRLKNGATEAKVSFSEAGDWLGGGGYVYELRKIRGIWFVVSVKQTWIS